MAAVTADLQQRGEELALLEKAAGERAAELAAVDVALPERRSELERLQAAIAQQRSELALLEAETAQRALLRMSLDGKYEVAATSGGGVVRYRIAFPVTGPVAEADLPNSPLESLAMWVKTKRRASDARHSDAARPACAFQPPPQEQQTSEQERRSVRWARGSSGGTGGSSPARRRATRAPNPPTSMSWRPAPRPKDLSCHRIC